MIKFETSTKTYLFNNRKEACEVIGRNRYEYLIKQGKITFE